jgi:hypothetical protein
MNTIGQAGLWLALTFCAFCLPAHGQGAGLRIEGMGGQPVVLTIADLRKFKRQTIEDRRTVTRNGESREIVVKYGGVALPDLLESVGLTKLDPHMQRRAAIFAIAGDGYQAAFSWGEVFNSDAGMRMLVIDEKDEQPLDAADGPLATVVFTDKRFGPRHVKRLVALRVVVGAP